MGIPEEGLSALISPEEAARLIREGYEFLPAGTKRQLHVAHYALAEGRKQVYVVHEEGGKTQQFSQLEVLGTACFVRKQMAQGCRTRYSVYLETSAVLAVKK